MLFKLNDLNFPPDDYERLSADNQKFVLKDIPADFEYYEKMYRNLCGCPYLRPLQDIIPDQSIFVFDYYTDHLLNVVQKDLPDAVIKRILHDALCGLATLHDHNIVHTGNESLLYTSSSQTRTDTLQTSSRTIS